MLRKFARPALVNAILFNLSLGGAGFVHAAVPNPDDVPGLSTLTSGFEDFEQVADYAKKAVVRLELLGLTDGQSSFFPKASADKAFLRQLLGTLDGLGEGYVTYGEAKELVAGYLLDAEASPDLVLSFEGFLSKKEIYDQEIISREDLAYLVAHAREADVIDKGEPIHNPAIATPGPLLGPTVFQSGSNDAGPVFDGSTVSLFHRARNGINTSFSDSPVFTLQVHPEVFKSVSAGGIEVDALQDLSAQLEVELSDGTVHRTPLTSLVPFSIHGADGKAGVIRIEDGLLVFADDLLGDVERFDLNGHAFTVEETVARIVAQAYYNGDATSEAVVSVVVDELSERGFTLQDRRLIAHNLILTKTALQQAGLSPLSSPFNTIAGPSSSSRNFKDGHLFTTYQLVEELRYLAETGQSDALRAALDDPDTQQNLLTGTKILTATTLLPHITALSNAPFLPNEALSSRVKKSGALLPSEPISFQFDRLKRAAYILLDDALSAGNASHRVTHGEIVRRDDAESQAFALSAGNFEALPLTVNQSVLVDALYDYAQAYEELVRLISGVEFAGSLVELGEGDLAGIDEAFSQPILSPRLGEVKIGELAFRLDMLGTPSHVREGFSPNNDLTQNRLTEGFGLESALEPFPVRLAEYVCNGEVVDEAGNPIAKAKIDPLEQVDLVSDFSTGPYEDCLTSTQAPRYHQLLFVDNFQLPPFGPSASFISTQGIEIINRLLLTPVESDLPIEDIRLSYRLSEAQLNEAPVAVIEGPEKARKGRFIKLSAGLSNDADGDALQYRWKVKSGKARIFQSRSSADAFVVAKRAGDLVVELQVNDGTANSRTVEKTIRIKRKPPFSFSRFFQRVFFSH